MTDQLTTPGEAQLRKDVDELRRDLAALVQALTEAGYLGSVEAAAGAGTVIATAEDLRAEHDAFVSRVRSRGGKRVAVGP